MQSGVDSRSDGIKAGGDVILVSWRLVHRAHARLRPSVGTIKYLGGIPDVDGRDGGGASGGGSTLGEVDDRLRVRPGLVSTLGVMHSHAQGGDGGDGLHPGERDGCLHVGKPSLDL